MRWRGYKENVFDLVDVIQSWKGGKIMEMKSSQQHLEKELDSALMAYIPCFQLRRLRIRKKLNKEATSKQWRGANLSFCLANSRPPLPISTFTSSSDNLHSLVRN